MKTFTTMKTVLWLTLILLLLSTTGTLQAKSATDFPEDIAARVQQKYDSMTSLSFTFNQQSKGQISGRPRVGSGEAFFLKNGTTSRMRWNYSTPDKQVLISDGKTFSMYFADLQQMIVTPADTLENDLTYSFFSGKARITEKFYILPPDPEYLQDSADASQPKCIKLVPIETQSQVQSIHLWISSDSLIRRIEIRDQFDTITLLNISKIEIDTLATGSAGTKTLFSFTPPEGTEIIHQ